MRCIFLYHLFSFSLHAMSRKTLANGKRAFRTDIWTLFFVVLLDLIGIGIIIPILAPLLLGNATTLVSASVDTGTRIIILGFLTGVYPLAQFFGAPILGALSDRYGRKPVLLLSLLGTFILKEDRGACSAV